MAFLDNLGKKISIVAGNAADKAKDLGEIAKLKAEIMRTQNAINSDLLELGRLVYENAKTDIDSPYADQCAKITGYYAEVENLRARIALVKEEDTTDCVITMTDEKKAEEEGKEEPATTLCPTCGKAVAEGSAFCPYCGAKLQ